jgi:hypothetical protein
MRGSAPFCWLAGAFSSSSSSSSPFFFVAVITFVSLRYSQLLPPSDPAPPSFFSLIPYSIRHISHTKAQKRSIHPSLNGSGERGVSQRGKEMSDRTSPGWLRHYKWRASYRNLVVVFPDRQIQNQKKTNIRKLLVEV